MSKIYKFHGKSYPTQELYATAIMERWLGGHEPETGEARDSLENFTDAELADDCQYMWSLYDVSHEMLTKGCENFRKDFLAS